MGRVHFDVSSMLLRRFWYARTGQLFRYVGIDASPQRPGLEVLATVERVIVKADIRDAQRGQPKPPVEQRRMPVSILGHGRCGLAEKVQAHIHQTWLEYGPSLEQVRAANADVRQVISDMGTELAIADTADVLQACIMPKQARAACSPGHPAHLAIADQQTYLYHVWLSLCQGRNTSWTARCGALLRYCRSGHRDKRRPRLCASG